jgi:purine nucleosidase
MSKDGLGDVSFAKTIEGHRHLIDRSEHAINTLIRMSKEVKDLNIIAIGPLTNIALALRMDPEFINRIASLTIMGGTYKGTGNITFNTEFNFRQDPEAVSIVLKAGFKNLTLIPWECCLRAQPITPD